MVSELRYIKSGWVDIFTRRPRPPAVDYDPDNWAHGVWTALAVTLAEPLRHAFQAHLDTHGCGEPGAGGFAYCQEASHLFSLLPAGDRILIA